MIYTHGINLQVYNVNVKVLYWICHNNQKSALNVFFLTSLVEFHVLIWVMGDREYVDEARNKFTDHSHSINQNNPIALFFICIL